MVLSPFLEQLVGVEDSTGCIDKVDRREPRSFRKVGFGTGHRYRPQVDWGDMHRFWLLYRQPLRGQPVFYCQGPRSVQLPLPWALYLPGLICLPHQSCPVPRVFGKIAIY